MTAEKNKTSNKYAVKALKQDIKIRALEPTCMCECRSCFNATKLIGSQCHCKTNEVDQPALCLDCGDYDYPEDEEEIEA
jgi:hypothetical protein